MRVIKFRVWDNTPSDIGGQTMLSWDQIRELVEHEIFLDSILEGEHESLIPMQFTGLTDANGVEIYEGDVVDTQSFCEGEHSIIEFKAGCFVAINPGNEFDFCFLDDYEFYVVGNIHQNPELLESDNV